MPTAMPAGDDTADGPLPRSQRLGRLAKKLLIAGSVAAIIIGAALTAMDLLSPDAPPIPTFDLPDTLEVPKNAPNGAPNATPTPSQPMPSPQGSLTVPPAADSEATGPVGGMPSLFDPTATMASRAPNGEVTGSVAYKTAPPPTGNAGTDPLPPSVSPAIRHGLAAGDPAAEYELGIRYAEGRGLTPSAPDAVRWLQRASDAGFAPAQFRLAGLNEKGDGIKKDAQAARRLYLAAATKGHAKAMHNLAVLYAEGIDGRPDYKAAAEWFRKAAGHGVTDSQYNLAILYARGIGVQPNLAESYRWFALAAAGGDTEAAKKRDQVAARLDQRTLATAKTAVQNFVAEREPDEATNLRAPRGGWDKAPPVQAKPKQPAP
jgi:localization factor PodJL